MAIISGYLYVLQVGNLYKLGRSVNVPKRLKQLQTGTNEELHIRYYLPVKDYIKAERMLHTIFNFGRKNGEWFELNSIDLILLDKIFGKLMITNTEYKRLERIGLR